MVARKEAVMTAVRNEIALTNAQQLMNVNLFPCKNALQD
jgi:hypothetical protein